MVDLTVRYANISIRGFVAKNPGRGFYCYTHEIDETEMLVFFLFFFFCMTPPYEWNPYE